MVKAVNKILRGHGWAQARVGTSWVHPRMGVWNILDAGQDGVGPHKIRDAWRLCKIDKWLGSNRRDAVIARNAGLVVNGGLVKALRTASKELAGDATGILVGGLRTDAQ